MCAGRMSPVSGSITATVSPAKSKQLLARGMRLAHRRRHAAAPLTVEITEPTIAVAVRMLRAILLPQQHQRHAAPLQLLMQLGPIGRRALRLRLARGREQPALKLAVIE